MFTDIFEEVASDRAYKSVVEALQQERELASLEQSHPAKEYKDVCDQLGLLDEEKNTLMTIQGDRGCRIVIPLGQRRRILKLLHAPHCGANKTIRTAKLAYYWPRKRCWKTFVTNCQAS